MKDFRVRMARPDDVVAVVRIANQAFLETARLTGPIGRSFAQQLRDGGEWLFVVEDEDGRVVGFLLGRHSGDTAKIGWIAVHPNYWGMGIGGMLLRAIEEKARRMGLRAVETGTPFARSFYEKYGFKCIGVQRALILEIAGKSIEPPQEVRTRPLLLDDLSSLANIMGRDDYLSLLSSYFSTFQSDPEKALLSLDGENVVGVVIGRADSIYRDLVTLEYLYSVEPRYALSLLYGLVYLSSVEGLRWVGVRFPVPHIDEEELRKKGWKDGELPTFWTRYWMRKDLK